MFGTPEGFIFKILLIVLLVYAGLITFVPAVRDHFTRLLARIFSGPAPKQFYAADGLELQMLDPLVFLAFGGRVVHNGLAVVIEPSVPLRTEQYGAGEVLPGNYYAIFDRSGRIGRLYRSDLDEPVERASLAGRVALGEYY